VLKGTEGEKERRTKSERGEKGVEVGMVPGHLAREGGLNLDICTGAVRVPSYATADWAVWSV